MYNLCRTVASAFIPADEDQCNDALESIFGKKHSCDMETTFCFNSMSNETTSQRRTYTCLCNFGYYVPNQTLQGFDGHTIESGSGSGNYSCIRCPGGCGHCNEKGECSNGESHEYVAMEALLKFSIGIVLGACMLCCLVLAAIVFRQRKCKVQFILLSLFSSVNNLISFHQFRQYRVECGQF